MGDLFSSVHAHTHWRILFYGTPIDIYLCLKICGRRVIHTTAIFTERCAEARVITDWRYQSLSAVNHKPTGAKLASLGLMFRN